MAVKLASAFITLVLLVAIAVVVLAAMLVIMNGFSENDATWGIAAFGLLVVMICILATVTSARLAARFAKKEMHNALNIVLSTLVSTIVGGVLLGASGFAGVIVADIVRRNF